MAATSTSSAPPPPYSQKAPPTRPTPEVNILLLGSPGVGKSTFLSALPQVRDGRLQSSMKNATNIHVNVPNPTSFSVALFNRPYNFVIYRSESTLFVDPFPSKIDFMIMCYAVDSRESLYNCRYYWRRQFLDRYERELGLTVPVMLLGLKRDLRTDEMRVVDTTAAIADLGGKEVSVPSARSQAGNSGDKTKEYVCVMPDEGVRAARDMRCDRYAECSALTGELLWEALEDITRTAALTTTDKGGMSQGQCSVM